MLRRLYTVDANDAIPSDPAQYEYQEGDISVDERFLHY